MSLPSECQTLGAIFHTNIRQDFLGIGVELPFNLILTEAEAKILEVNLHNAIELVLARYWEKK